MSNGFTADSKGAKWIDFSFLDNMSTTPHDRCKFRDSLLILERVFVDWNQDEIASIIRNASARSSQLDLDNSSDTRVEH